MRLSKVQITRFRSIWDSTEFDIGEITCLVGKNESGKTALLQALYKLNPLNSEDGDFDVRMDYPRQSVAQYRRQVERGEKEDAEAVKATYALERSDIEAVEEAFGENCFTVKEPVLTIAKRYSNRNTIYSLDIDEDAILRHLIADANLSVEENKILLEQETLIQVSDALSELSETEAVLALHRKVSTIVDRSYSVYIYQQVLKTRIPKFLYFDEYYLMRGQDNLNALVDRVRNDELLRSDYPLIGLIELAGLELEELLESDHTQTLTAEISAAESALSAMILPYWSQNKNLRMKFDIRVGLDNDPEGMREGLNIWGLVVNTRNHVELPIETRSRGFVWFFSFLAWYSNLRGEGEDIILLLDEPGLSLHAKAQEDLLRYIDKELRPHHQVIYTTHSPFMVDPHNLDRARIVQDMGMEQQAGGQANNLGTEVLSEIREATNDTLFPLQGALGYEIYQNLFIGPNSLVVEGVSDLMYIQIISGILQERGEEGLSDDWVTTPVGGVTNVPTFVALIGAQGKLNVVVLVDRHKRDEQKIGNLYRERLLTKKKILTYADFLPQREADVEDMFDPEFYLKLVNETYGANIHERDLPSGKLILKRLEEHLKINPLPNSAKFNHYRPAKHFLENTGELESELSDLELDNWRHAFKTINPLLKK